MNDTYITVTEFLTLLAGSSPAGIVVPADWYKGTDILINDEPLQRKNAARLFHLFLLRVLKEADEENTDKAWKLRDIYDCRVCAAHIAQIYQKGIMDAFFYEDVAKGGSSQKEDGFSVFENNRNIGKEEAIDCIKRVYNAELRRKR